MDYQLLFNYDFQPPVWAFGATTVVLTLFLLLFFAGALRRVRRRVASDSSGSMPEQAYPEVSVIIYANSNTSHIKQLLDDIFAQDYPAETEVIVVTDGSFDEVERIIGNFQLTRSNLYLTFIPDKSRNLSRRKLAITLGVKAARFDVVMLTEANTHIASPQWLRHMARHFVVGKKIVAGYAYSSIEADTSGAFRTRAFDSVWEGVSWLSPAILSYPHRGIGANLAYSRRLFFDNKGFSNSLNLNYGDDDIFVNEIATDVNSAVELSEQSQVEMLTDDPASMHALNKIRRNFTHSITGGFYRKWMTLASWAMWLLTGSAIATAIVGLPSLLPLIAAAICWLATVVTISVGWRRTSRALNSRPLTLTVVPLMMFHPFYDLRYRIKGWKTRKRNYTWSN